MEEEFHINKFANNSIDPTVSAGQIADYNAQRPKKNPSSLCYAPFIDLYFGREGTVHCCCNNRHYSVGEYPKDTIDGIWNGSRINRLREHLVNNSLSLSCDYCQDDFNRCSYSQVAARHFDRVPLNISHPSMMEFELDTTCNLECSMCTGELSSSIRRNRDRLPPIPSRYDRTFVEQLRPYLPHLHETRFSGGEPFLIPIYYEIWEALTDVNPRCLISVQTNGAVMNNKVMSYLEKGRFEIGVSLDSLVKETFEDIRVNAKFENVMKNVHWFSDYCKRKGTGFRLSICVMRNNWKELPEYIDLCNELNAYACFHKVFEPDDLSLIHWDSTKLKEVHDRLSSYQWNPKNNLEQINADHYQDYVMWIGKWQKNQEKQGKREKYEKQKDFYRAKDLSELYALLQQAMIDNVRRGDNEMSRSFKKIESKLSEACQHLTERQHKEVICQLLSFDPDDVFDRILHSETAKLTEDITDLVASGE